MGLVPDRSRTGLAFEKYAGREGRKEGRIWAEWRLQEQEKREWQGIGRKATRDITRLTERGHGQQERSETTEADNGGERE